jgi:hypothetical protein
MGVKWPSYWATTPRLDLLFGRKAPLKKYKGKNPQRYPRNHPKGIPVTSLEVPGITLERYRGYLLKGCKRRVSRASKAPILISRAKGKGHETGETHTKPDQYLSEETSTPLDEDTK